VAWPELRGTVGIRTILPWLHDGKTIPMRALQRTRRTAPWSRPPFQCAGHSPQGMVRRQKRLLMPDMDFPPATHNANLAGVADGSSLETA